MRMQNKNIDVLTSPTTFDCRTSGVARGGPHNDHFFATTRQHMIEQSSEKLKSKIFKGQRGPLEEF